MNYSGRIHHSVMKFWKNTKITGSYLDPYFRSSIYWMITFIILLCIHTASLNAQEKTAKTVSELAISYLKKIGFKGCILCRRKRNDDDRRCYQPLW